MIHAPAATSYVDLNLLTKIELLILKRLAGGTTGDHRSRADGSGFDFVGLRDWQAGDRFSSIDWPQSSITNFSPMVVREFDQPSSATVLAGKDGCATRICGTNASPTTSPRITPPRGSPAPRARSAPRSAPPR